MGKKGKGKKGRALTGLAAALVKSGHLDEKRARKLAREQRRDERALTPEERAERDAAKQVEAKDAREAEAAANRQRERERAAEEQARRIERVLADGRWRGGGGRRRWFYVARDGEVQFLELDDAAAGMLRDGEAGIVEDPVSPLGHSVLAGQRGLVTLVGIDPEHVRFWNRAQAPERRPE